MYLAYVSHFDQNESNFRNGVLSKGEKDFWFVESQFIRSAKEALQCLGELRELLMKSWDEGIENELDRIRGIKNLYEDIMMNNKKFFQANET